MNTADYDTYDLGDVKLLSGQTLFSAKLVYKTYGSLNSNSEYFLMKGIFLFVTLILWKPVSSFVVFSSKEDFSTSVIASNL